MPRAVLISAFLAVVLAGCSSSNGGTGGDASVESGGGEDTGSPAPDGSPGGPDASTGHDASTPSEGGNPADAPDESAVPGYTLTWSDEFDGADGSAPDPSKWTYDIGGSGWGNNEREYYTSTLANSQQQGGNLIITATPDGASSLSCWYGTCLYTSARLKTQGLFAQAYGRFEARAQMPFGKGLWPAFWMLGSDISTVNWPACGEIDILETIGTDVSTNHGSLHAPGYNPTGTYPLPDGGTYAEAFHTFAIEWEPGEIRFYVDDQLYETRDQSGVPDGGTWEFDTPFFIILNVAVGGNWPGDPDSTTTFPQTLKVDWVRVYQKNGADY
jgi:beta-glucanase (GH16 family)